MAIYSLSHSSIGKTTQEQPHTAAAHIDYITRERAASHLEARRMPALKEDAASFMRVTENALRKNGRVADKIMLALPRELTPEQRVALVTAFAEHVTDSRASWFAAFHDKGKDKANPHCHLVVHDRDATTGKRVFGMSEKGSTQRLRKLWEEQANTALTRANRHERIDRRTLRAQGLTRRPTIHVGVRARQLVRNGRAMASRDLTVHNHCQAHTRSRTVAYPAIDGGRLRLEHNVQIRRTNMLASREEDREEEYWKAIDQDALARDVRELRRLHAVLEYGPDGITPTRSRSEGLSRGGLDF